MKTPNPLDPKAMKPYERITEVASLLATGLIRMRFAHVTQSTESDKDDAVRLGFSAKQRVHDNPTNKTLMELQ